MRTFRGINFIPFETVDARGHFVGWVDEHRNKWGYEVHVSSFMPVDKARDEAWHRLIQMIESYDNPPPK